MTNIAIQAAGLSKQYRIGEKQRSRRLSDAIVDAVNAPVRALRRFGQPLPPEELIWALKDVSFEVQHGEVLGVIGRNGAGKSTLLKILSRITTPTEGTARIIGRVGSLLEVGTGFHPELTGRENVYLNGAILGMTQSEINRKFDEIVAFAEIDQFIDTPVKRYSSGMGMRLAFAVAAHLEPEILLIDEVLAVGDTAFQQKCLGKMEGVAREGRTIIFISHNMGAIANLCSRCILLESGRVVFEGDTSPTIQRYLQYREDLTPIIKFSAIQSDAYFTNLAITDPQGNPSYNHDLRKPIKVFLRFDVKRPIKGLDVTVKVFNYMLENIFFSDCTSDSSLTFTREGTYTVSAQIPAHLLPPGTYTIDIALHVPGRKLYQHYQHVVSFEVEYVEDQRFVYNARDLGRVLVALDWQPETEMPG